MFPFITYIYLVFVALTSRIRLASKSPESILILRESRPVVFTCWFESILFLLYYFGTKKMPVLMTPKSKTDFFTKLSSWFRLRVAKGSLEGGGRHAILILIEEVKAGSAVLIPADGSRGPEKKCKANSMIVAHETSVPLIPVSWNSRFKIKIPRKYVPIYMPLPFSSIEVELGSPIPVYHHFQTEEMEGIKNQIQVQLMKMSEQKTTQEPVTSPTA